MRFVGGPRIPIHDRVVSVPQQPRRPVDLTKLLQPQSIAVIGASANSAVISGMPLRILGQHGYPGALYPVNPRHAEIAGLPCYPRIGAVPEPVDLALVVVHADAVPQVVADCGRAGTRFAVVISSGFAEQDPDGVRQRALRAACAAYPGMRVLGPNSEGLMNVVHRIPLTFSPTVDEQRGMRRLRTGDIAVVSQSGGLGFALFNDGLERGLGFSHVVSTGNELDLDLADVAEHLAADPGTRVLLLFLEGLPDPARLADVAAAAGLSGTRVVVAKAGTSAAGRRAALAHTAHDAGEDSAYAELFDKHGMVRARDQEHIVDLAMAFSRTSRLRGPRVGVLTTSGGAGTWLADDLVAAGLEVPLLGAATQRRLRACIPAYGSPANPVDATAQVFSGGGIGPVLDALATSGEVDAIACVLTLADAHRVEHERDTLAAAAARLPLVVYSYTRPAERSIDALAQLGIAYFTSGARTAAALRALAG
jgi:acyl-CoA synthetase (NDP forming)